MYTYQCILHKARTADKYCRYCRQISNITH